MDRVLVGVGLLGSQLDGGRTAARWEKWRPTISLFQNDDLLFERYHLLVHPRFSDLADLVVDDIARISPATEVIRDEVDLEDPWDFEEVYGALFDYARGKRFDPAEENLLVHITTGSHVAQICMFLLTESRHLPGRLIQSAPPRGGRPRYEIIDLDLSRYDQLATRFSAERDEGLSFLKAGIDTRNADFNALIERIERVARASTAPMLLQGPTGAGKTQLARRIYELKRNRNQVTGPFVQVNCATLRGDQAMSALFGHRRGAFTGAVSDRDGLLRTANDGILFLDEVGELGSDEQAMLLRAIEHGRFLPVGSDREVGSDFQLICGTNRDLRASVASGAFREDLLARIDLWTFHLPGLAERREDLAPNLDYELNEVARRTGSRVYFSKEARASYLDFARSPEATWAANFRDLNASITRMATLALDGRITEEDVAEELGRLRAQWRVAAPVGPTELAGLDLPPLDRFDQVQLAEVVRVCRASRSLSEAGRVLFAVSREKRKTKNDADRLRKYLKKFDLDFDGVQ